MGILSKIINKIKGTKVKNKTTIDPIPYEIDSNIFFADISHHRKSFDVLTYAKKYKLLIHKTTQGASMVDPKWNDRKYMCDDAKLKIVGYHFYNCYIDPIKQAEHYLKNHGDFKGLNPIIDFETEGSKQKESDLIADIENFYLCLKHVQKATGLTPIIYANLLCLQRLQLDKKFAEFYIWPARYNKYMMFVPYPWTPDKLFARQYSDGGRVYSHPDYPNKFDGVNDTVCDSNIYNLKVDLYKL